MENATGESCTASVPGTHLSLLKKQRKMPFVRLGKYQLVYELTKLDEVSKEKARKELRETPEVVAQALKEIRKLVKEDAQLNVLDEDEFYQKFLRPCKWYASSAFVLMQNFYRFHVNYQDFCKDLLPSKQKNIFTSGLLCPLPFRTKDGCRVLLIYSGKNWNPKEITVYEIFKAIVLIITAATTEFQTQICGMHIIFDMNGMNLSHVTCFTPRFALLVTDWLSNCSACRLKGVHIVNQPFLFKMIFSVFKPFLNEKRYKRVYFHGTNRESLYSFINPEALPESYGGELEIPDEIYGEDLWKYFCFFDEDFAAALSFGYPKKA